MVVIKTRKGDVTISTVILIVLGLAVLVMMIVGFTKGWDVFFGAFDNAPSDLQTFAKACQGYALGGLSIDFCDYRLIGDELVNCKDSRIADSLKEVNTASLKCGNTDKIKSDACKSLVPSCNTSPIGGKCADVKFNGDLRSCQDIVTQENALPLPGQVGPSNPSG